MDITQLDYRVPIIDPDSYPRRYGHVPVDLEDPRASEPLVLLDDHGIAYESYYARTDGDNWPYFGPVPGARPDMFMREGAAASLARVNDRLRPFGFELFGLDGYRPIALQQGLFDFRVGEGRRKLDDPTEQDCIDYALGYVRPTDRFSPDRSDAWPLHSTGSAIDAFLRHLDTGELADLGTRFDDHDATIGTDYYERALLAGEIDADDPRLWHRRLMHWALTEEDWINSPWTLWHFDLGNQLYVLLRPLFKDGAPEKAWYGYIEDPPRVVPA